ncbi:hypothetical protein JKF63_01360 [Porcisia hertigi]|uniref:tRNA N(3)-methylcytidine methyltransferase n=1 Tax=Porcisia hertigi TaxID=2761500 RepID=A0A836HXX4_9TRYP|nr:hypothetical protein JKF63_01360 [Porcisia hertigi]
MSSAAKSGTPTQPSHAENSSCTLAVSEERKRARSPPYLPFVSEYQPYRSGQLQAHRVHRRPDLHRRQWDLYYRNNTVNGYKDRHYILREFHELRAAINAAVAADEKAQTTAKATSRESAGLASSTCPFSWMEAGCGVGNAMLPVFAQYGHLRHWRALLGFDISPVAISLLEEKRAQLPPDLAAKVHVCVLDPSLSDVTDCPFFKGKEVDSMAVSPSCGGVVGRGIVDCDSSAVVDRSSLCEYPEFVSLIFVLCSIPVSSHAVVLRRIAHCMKRPGGVLYFRDYCISDHAERRFQESLHRRRSGTGNATDDTNTYERSNGTLSHFFSLEEVRTLFEGVGFDVIALEVITNKVINRKTSVSFARRFVQGRFRLRG